MTVELRPGVSAQAVAALEDALDAVPWTDLTHAYGPAGDVPALLFAVTLGAEPVRAGAWVELYETVHHQGTVYPATPSAVPFVAAVAAVPDHPDRVNAVSLLRQVAIADGAAAAASRSAVEDELGRLVGAWAQQPRPVQQALVLLVSAFPGWLKRHPGLSGLVPEHLRPAWNELLAAGGDPRRLDGTDPVMDRQDELERWALDGWNDLPGR